MRTLRSLTARGYAGPGGGRVGYVESPTEFYGTSRQICGLWPFAAGSGAPTIGAPLGPQLRSGGGWVSGDPVTFFTRARLIRAPSAFILGLNGLGKSTVSRRWTEWDVTSGIKAWNLGDLKPDQRDLVDKLDGQVLRTGPGLGVINPLSGGALARVLPKIKDLPDDYHRISQQVHGRQLALMKGLLALSRGRDMADHEPVLLAAAIRELNARFWPTETEPVMQNLIDLLTEGPTPLRAAILAETDDGFYRSVANALARGVAGLRQGVLGDTFDGRTTIKFDLDAPAIDVDISAIRGQGPEFEGAVQLATWKEGFDAAEASHVMSDLGRGPERNFHLKFDEFWQPMQTAELVATTNELVRTDRTKGTAETFITHSVADLDSLPTPEARTTARGFIERAGMLMLFGLPPIEFERLSSIMAFTDAERADVTSWSAPASLDSRTNLIGDPPGIGKCLMKIGSLPGVPLKMWLTATERNSGVHNTNRRWDTRRNAA